MKHLPYNRNLKMFYRDLINSSTLSEVLLWNELKAGKIKAYKFNRQKPLLKYIADFYCKKLSLVIEVDGNTHTYEGAYDRDVKHQKELESIGLVFLRFDDLDVKEKISDVLKTITELRNLRRYIPQSPFKGDGGG